MQVRSRPGITTYGSHRNMPRRRRGINYGGLLRTGLLVGGLLTALYLVVPRSNDIQAPSYEGTHIPHVVQDGESLAKLTVNCPIEGYGSLNDELVWTREITGISQEVSPDDILPAGAIVGIPDVCFPLKYKSEVGPNNQPSVEPYSQ